MDIEGGHSCGDDVGSWRARNIQDAGHHREQPSRTGTKKTGPSLQVGRHQRHVPMAGGQRHDAVTKHATGVLHAHFQAHFPAPRFFLARQAHE